MAEPWADGDVPTAAQLAAMAWGPMGYVNGATADQSGIGGITDITGLAVVFTAIPSRLYRTTLVVVTSKQTGAGNIAIYIADSAGTSLRQATEIFATNDTRTLVVVHLETGITGLTTRKARIAASANTCTVIGIGQQNATFIVEDAALG